MSQFTLTENVLVKGFEGYGAQLNQNVFAQITRDLGVTDAHLQELPGHLRKLAPRFVRIFFDPRARHGQVPSSDDLMQSFKKTVELAQSAASSINITWTGGGAPGTMTSFADVLADLVANHGATKLRWVTIMNEPNGTKISLDDYTALYQALHHELETRGLASQIRLMGGDLVQTHQEEWCHHLETMFDLVEAWSIHIYWKYDALGPGAKTKLVKRLTDVHRIWSGCNAGQRSPCSSPSTASRAPGRSSRKSSSPTGRRRRNG